MAGRRRPPSALLRTCQVLEMLLQARTVAGTGEWDEIASGPLGQALQPVDVVNPKRPRFLHSSRMRSSVSSSKRRRSSSISWIRSSAVRPWLGLATSSSASGEISRFASDPLAGVPSADFFDFLLVIALFRLPESPHARPERAKPSDSIPGPRSRARLNRTARLGLDRSRASAGCSAAEGSLPPSRFSSTRSFWPVPRSHEPDRVGGP